MWGGGGLKEVLEKVFILPVDRDGRQGAQRADKSNDADHRCSLMETLSAWQNARITALCRAHTHKRTPRYLAGGTSSTGPGHLCARSNLDNPEPH